MLMIPNYIAVDKFISMTGELSSCSDDVDDWMTINKLSKNNDKTEILLCGTFIN